MSSTNHIFRCDTCKVAYAVSARDKVLPLLVAQAEGVKCPNYPCRGKVTRFAKTNARIKAVKVTAAELYQAHHLGFKSERRTAKDLSELLQGAVIVGVDLATTQDKTVIYTLALKNGKVVHFGPSTQGAIITRVTEKNHGGRRQAG
jgi:hypothetical protein